MGKATLPNSVAGIISRRAYFTTGRGNTAVNNESTEEAALKDRIEKLKRLVGRLTMENEFFKKGLQNSVSQSQRNGKSSRGRDISSIASDGGVD